MNKTTLRHIAAAGMVVVLGCHDWHKTTDGKEYYLETICTESHSELETGYHFGNYFGMDYQGHYTYHYGGHFPYQCFNSHYKTICDSYKTDTVFKK